MATPDVGITPAEGVLKSARAASVLAHIAERRIEYLLGSLIAYQLGLLDQFVTYGSQCIA